MEASVYKENNAGAPQRGLRGLMKSLVYSS